MYGSYSLLIVSLIPTFISAGELNNAVKLYNDGIWDYNKAKPYENTANICSAISIGCGVLFVFELIRYFYAANSVLPQKAKIVPESKQIIFNQPFETPPPKDTESQNDKINAEQNQTENEKVTESETLTETEIVTENKEIIENQETSENKKTDEVKN